MTVFNGVDDGGYAGYPKGSRTLFLYLNTSIGVKTTDYFHVVRAGNGVTTLIGGSTKPSQPGVAPGDLTIQKFDLYVSGAHGPRPYLTNPPTCGGGWSFALSIKNYFGQPPVTAHDRVGCRR